MGMTIDESISQIIDSLMGKKAYLLDHSDRVALTNALNTMRKYQKLEAYMRKLEKSAQYGTLRKLKIALGEIEDEQL